MLGRTPLIAGVHDGVVEPDRHEVPLPLSADPLAADDGEPTRRASVRSGAYRSAVDTAVPARVPLHLRWGQVPYPVQCPRRTALRTPAAPSPSVPRPGPNTVKTEH